MDFNLENMAAQGAGFHHEDILAKAIRVVRESFSLLADQTVHSAFESDFRAVTMEQRAMLFYSEGILSIDEANSIVETTKETHKIYKETMKVARKELDKLNEKITSMVESSSNNIESFINDGYADKLEKTKADEKLKKIAKKLAEETRDASQQSVIAWKQEIEKIKADPSRASELPNANRRLQQAEEMAAKDEELYKAAITAAEKATTAITDAQKLVDATSYKRIIKTINSVLKKTLIDINAVANRIKAFSGKLKEAGDLITKGYKVYFDRFAQGSEEISHFWADAIKSVDDSTGKDANRYVDEIRKLEHITDEDEFLSEAAKYLTPSARMWMNTQEEFRVIREAEGFRMFRYGEYFAAGIKASVKVPIGVSYKLLETLLGEEVAASFALVVSGVGDLILPATMFYLVEWPLIKMEFNIVVDFLKDGATWKFVDDVLKYMYLSLTMFENKTQILEGYPPRSIVKDSAKSHPIHIDLLKYDSQELAITIDFWGKQYIKWMNLSGHKLPEYQKLKEFIAINRIPGRYIDTKNHPNESESEVRQCQDLERLVSMASKGDGTTYYSSSMIDSWFPKSTEKGVIRNLAAFPVYQETFQWPNVEEGEVVQKQGYFSESDLDDTIVALFKNMAKTGKFGPVYNTGKTKEIRAKGVAANLLDLERWLKPKKTDPMTWMYVREWVKSLRGKKGIMLNDMLVFAPEDFLQEWNNDLPPNAIGTGLFPWNPQRGPTYNKFMTKTGYEDRRQATGRWTYRPMDQTFLKEAFGGKGVLTLKAYNLGPLSPMPAYVEVFPNPVNFSVGQYSSYDKATPQEKEFYKKIYDKGLGFKQLIDRKKTETYEKWDLERLNVIWGDYMRSEVSTRTVWSYIVRYKTDFITELMFICNVLAGKGRAKAWADYIKLVTGSNVPLLMDSVHRTTFMGMFASMAYSPKLSDSGKFKKQITDRFGPILENGLVTTDPHWKASHWAGDITEAVVGKGSLIDDLIGVFGNVSARVLVLGKPRVMVIAFNGSTDATQWKIALDFVSSKFTTLKAQKKTNSFHLVDEPDGSQKSAVTLSTDKEMMQIHGGFLRVCQHLQGPLVEMMNKYFKKHNITEVFLTGHGLGAAMVSIMTMMVPRLPVTAERGTGKSGFKNPNCYMFSSPTVGDERFQKKFRTWSGESVQIWLDGDTIVMLPPFLIPDKKQSLKSFNDTMASIRVLSGKSKALAGLLFLEHEIINHLKLPPQLDLSQLFKDYKTFDKRLLGRMIHDIWKAANTNRSLRAGGVFMRLNGLHRFGFHETTYDTGNSEKSFGVIASLPNILKDNKANHSLVNVVGQLSMVAKAHPDLFDINAKDLPSWAGGDIGPDDPDKPDKPDQRKIDKGIAEQLKNGTAKIVGYGKSKHWHKPWSIVPNSDVQVESGVWMSDETQKIINGLSHQGSKKRRKIDKHDHTYRGSDYM